MPLNEAQKYDLRIEENKKLAEMISNQIVEKLKAELEPRFKAIEKALKLTDEDSVIPGEFADGVRSGRVAAGKSKSATEK